MQFCNIDEKLVKYIGEVNKYKFNKYTPGSKIKIISENKIKKFKPDYLFVLLWHFKNFSDGVFIFYICMETLKKIHKNFVGSFAQMGPTWIQYLNVIVGFYGWFIEGYLKSNNLHDYALFYQLIHWWLSLKETGNWVLIILVLFPVCWIIFCMLLWFPSFVVTTIWLFIKDKKVPW